MSIITQTIQSIQKDDKQLSQQSKHLLRDTLYNFITDDAHNQRQFIIFTQTIRRDNRCVWLEVIEELSQLCQEGIFTLFQNYPNCNNNKENYVLSESIIALIELLQINA
jgi:hypothetical protein